MTDDIDQITKCYESGADEATIAQGFGVPVAQVKALLYSKSAKYRKSLARESKANVPIDEEMLDIVATLARESDNELIKLSAAKFVRDDVKGRRDAIPVDQNKQNAVIDFLTARLAAAELARKKFYDMKEAHVIAQ